MAIQFDFDFGNEDVRFDGKFVKATTEVIGDEVYERAYLGSGVSVIPVRRAEGQLLLIKEFRAHHGDDGETPWKLVTGWVEEKHKSFLEAAQQELAEEAGARSDEWEELYDAHHRATVSARKKYFVCYDPIFDVNIPNPDGDMVLEKQWVSEGGLWQMMERREISWTRDVLVALIALRHL